MTERRKKTKEKVVEINEEEPANKRKKQMNRKEKTKRKMEKQKTQK